MNCHHTFNNTIQLMDYLSQNQFDDHKLELTAYLD